jgi:hypothetical protein
MMPAPSNAMPDAAKISELEKIVRQTGAQLWIRFMATPLFTVILVSSWFRLFNLLVDIRHCKPGTAE